MAEVKIDRVRPNLLVRDRGDLREIVYAVDEKDVVSSGRVVNEIVGKHIGELNVTYLNHDSSLTSHLDEIERRGVLPMIGNQFSKHFGLSFVMCVETCNRDQIDHWLYLGGILKEPQRRFDELEKSLAAQLDREKTLERATREYNELTPQIPESRAIFFVLPSELKTRRATTTKYVGVVKIERIRGGYDKIPDTQLDLTKRLSEFEGPCLSLDAISLPSQLLRTMRDAENLVNEYGDVLLTDVNSRMFCLDP